MRQPGSIGLRLAIDAAHCCARLRQQGPVLNQFQNTLHNDLIYFSDLRWMNYPSRFYHIRSP